MYRRASGDGIDQKDEAGARSRRRDLLVEME
jgi:hypothetical protein